MGDIKCLVCRRRTPATGLVCDRDRTTIDDMLLDLARRMADLATALPPASAAGSERVGRTRAGSKAPTRMDVLTMVAPGSDGLSAAAAQTPDDQTGMLPPAEWLDSWARTWRQRLGHTDRIEVTRPQPRPVLTGRTARQWAADTITGLRGRLPLDLRPVDPVAAEWELRFGTPELPAAVAADIGYLRTWLDRACDDTGCGVDDFAAELRTMVAELGRILGEHPDHQWLGRCPAELDGDEQRICGFGLWQDPYLTRVTCRRCRRVWGPGAIALLHLAAQIRRAWPLDRRRRYTRTDIDDLVARCPGCAAAADVAWRETTAVGERERTWRPDAVTCPNGCDEVRRLL